MAALWMGPLWLYTHVPICYFIYIHGCPIYALFKVLTDIISVNLLLGYDSIGRAVSMKLYSLRSNIKVNLIYY